jgi:hypothetical protein
MPEDEGYRQSQFFRVFLWLCQIEADFIALCFNKLQLSAVFLFVYQMDCLFIIVAIDGLMDCFFLRHSDSTKKQEKQNGIV